jgi:hypothetical protein
MTVGDSLRWSRGTLYPLKLALTSPTSGGRPVGIVRARGLKPRSFFCVKYGNDTARLQLWDCLPGMVTSLKETALLVNAYVHWMVVHLIAVWKLRTTISSAIFKHLGYHHTPQIFYNLMMELYTNYWIPTVVRKSRQTRIHKRPQKNPNSEFCFLHGFLQAEYLTMP